MSLASWQRLVAPAIRVGKRTVSSSQSLQQSEFKAPLRDMVSHYLKISTKRGYRLQLSGTVPV